VNLGERLEASRAKLRRMAAAVSPSWADDIVGLVMLRALLRFDGVPCETLDVKLEEWLELEVVDIRESFARLDRRDRFAVDLDAPITAESHECFTDFLADPKALLAFDGEPPTEEPRVKRLIACPTSLHSAVEEIDLSVFGPEPQYRPWVPLQKVHEYDPENGYSVTASTRSYPSKTQEAILQAIEEHEARTGVSPRPIDLTSKFSYNTITAAIATLQRKGYLRRGVKWGRERATTGGAQQGQNVA
jgi:hypothetical protein